jgi:hypothetical protein
MYNVIKFILRDRSLIFKIVQKDTFSHALTIVTLTSVDSSHRRNEELHMFIWGCFGFHN